MLRSDGNSSFEGISLWWSALFPSEKEEVNILVLFVKIVKISTETERTQEEKKTIRLLYKNDTLLRTLLQNSLFLRNARTDINTRVFL